MDSKVCSKCHVKKSTKYFNKDRGTKDGLQYYCNSCRSLIDLTYQRIKSGVVSQMIKDQKKSSKRRGHKMPEYSKVELRNWVLFNPKFNTLYIDWVESNYDTNKKPSIDRLDDSIGYCFENIQITTWSENRSKQHNKNIKKEL